MLKIKCKTCGKNIDVIYEPLYNDTEKEIINVEHDSTENCNKSIYLTCDDSHINKYYCQIKEKVK